VTNGQKLGKPQAVETQRSSQIGALAQLGERRLCKPEVTGSNPVRSIPASIRV
jgi:hypothetical protein